MKLQTNRPGSKALATFTSILGPRSKTLSTRATVVQAIDSIRGTCLPGSHTFPGERVVDVGGSSLSRSCSIVRMMRVWEAPQVGQVPPILNQLLLVCTCLAEFYWPVLPLHTFLPLERGDWVMEGNWLPWGSRKLVERIPISCLETCCQNCDTEICVGSSRVCTSAP